MKPKTGEDCIEMEPAAQDPLDLVKQLVLLIVEARTPDPSAKGRVEGPHCPIIRGGPPHHCARDKKECFRATEFCRSATQLWTNEIPICIDILLFPNCPHGWEEVMVTEGAVTSMADENALLVERWMVVSEKRRHDSGLGSNLLLQAVRSYLHFSQISSWLYSEKGKLPSLLAFRIYAPGEESSLNFLVTPDSHAFPFCILRYDSIKVTVSAMQRISQVPVLLCASESHEQYKVCESESGAEGGLLMGKLSRSKLTDKYEEQMDELKAGQASRSAQKSSHGKKEETKTKNNFGKPEPRSRKTSKRDCLHGNNSYNAKGNVLRWNENWSAVSKSKVTNFSEMNDPRRRDGTGIDKTHHKEILKEHKNGTEETRIFYPEKSVDWMEEIWKPKGHCRKKDGEKDRRIEQMKFAAASAEGIEMAGLKNSMNKKKSEETKNKTFFKKQDRDFSFLLMDNAASQKEQFWTNFSKRFGGSLEKSQTADAAHFFHKENDEKPKLDKRREASTDVLWSLMKSSEWDTQMQPSLRKPSSQMDLADDVEKKSCLAASEAFEEDFIRRLSERMTLAQTKPFVKSPSAEIKALLFTSEHKNQDIKTRMDIHFQNVSSPKRKDNLNTCGSQHNTLRSAEKQTSKSPSITEVTDKTIPGQSFQDLSNRGESEMRMGCKESNVCNAVKSIPPLSQLTVDISWSDFEMEWDSDDTPTASPNNLSSSRSSGSSLLKAVTARQMMGSVNSAANNLEKEDMVEPEYCNSPVVGQKFEPVMFVESSPFKSRENEFHDGTFAISSLPTFQTKIDPQKDAIFHPSQDIRLDEAESLPSKKTNSDNLSFRNDVMVTNHVVRPQGTIRKKFEENLLPLASYDAQTDSFKIVDPNNQVKVLHSPKVLLSCDVPTEEAISSKTGRCIDFEENIDSELFMSRLQEITPSHGLPHSIGSYMSRLAALSLKEEHKKETMVHGQSDTCPEENTADKLKNTENELSYVKDGSVCEPNGKAAKVLQDAVVRVKTTFKEGKEDGEGRMDLEKEKIYDQKEGFHYNGNAVDHTVEDEKELGNITEDNLSKSKGLILHEEYSNKYMEREFKEQDKDNGIFKNVGKESCVNEHEKRVAKCLDFPHSGIKSETETSFTDTFNCQSDYESESCNSTHSDSDPNSVLNTKDCSPSASPVLPVSLSSSTSSNLTNYISPSSSHLLLSFPLGSSIHSTPPAPSSLNSFASDKSQDCSIIEKREWTDIKSLIVHGQTVLPATPSDDSPQFISNFSTLNKEKLCSLSSDRDKHSFNILSSSGKSQLDIPTSFHSFSQQPYKYSDNISSHNSALASLSMVDTENQPHSQELTPPRSATQICHTGTKSSDHAFTKAPVQKDFTVRHSWNNEQKNGIPSNVDKMVNCSSLLLGSFPKVDNYITYNDSSSELIHETESALKDISYELSLDSESCSTVSTGVISKDLCPSMNGALKHPRLSSLLNSTNPTSCGRVNMSHNFSDIKGSSFSNLNAINMSLQASQSLSFQTTCDNEGGKSLTCHASSNIDNDISLNFSSSTGIEFPKAICSQFEGISIQQTSTKSDLDINSSQNGISEEGVCKNKNKDNTPTASSSSERILINNLECNHIFSHSGSHEGISQFERMEEPQNLSKLHSTEVKAENGLPMNNLLHTGADSSSQIYGPDPDMCYVGSKEQYHVCHSFLEDKVKADAFSHKEEALSSALKCAQSGRSCEDSDDNEVFFYLDDSAAPIIPKTCSSSHPSSLASSLMLSSSSCALIDTPFSSLSTANIGKPSSLSTEAGMDLECSPNHDLDQGSFRRSRMASYGDNLPGWTPNPPHRSVSTPDCAEGEVRGRGYQRSTCSRSTSILQQSDKDGVNARRAALTSSSMIFNSRTALPTQSSPAPLKRKPGGRFDYDASLLNVRAIKNAFSCSKLTLGDNKEDDDNEDNTRTLSTSAPASTNCLLGNFEESILNGRIDPVGTVDGFSAEIGASGSFCPKHLHLPVSAFFFALSDDNAPSPYLGHINLNAVSKKGYHIPKKGTLQVTLFNPNKTVVKMFVVMYDLSDMPLSSQTFIRQRTMYIPTDKNSTAPSYLRYLIHLRCSSSRSGKIYLHTDIRLIFARHKLDIDAKTVPYEMKSYTDVPRNPKYSPKK